MNKRYYAYPMIPIIQLPILGVRSNKNNSCYAGVCFSNLILEISKLKRQLSAMTIKMRT